MPLAGYNLERLLASVLELDAGACDQILDRSGNENLTRLSECGESRSDVHRQTSELLEVAR